MKTHYVNLYEVHRTKYRANHSPERTTHGMFLNLEDAMDLARSLSHQYKRVYLISLQQHEWRNTKYIAIRSKPLYAAVNNKLLTFSDYYKGNRLAHPAKPVAPAQHHSPLDKQ